jgi:hypothetical protein
MWQYSVTSSSIGFVTSYKLPRLLIFLVDLMECNYLSFHEKKEEEKLSSLVFVEV